jgi:hypothetical protein
LAPAFCGGGGGAAMAGGAVSLLRSLEVIGQRGVGQPVPRFLFQHQEQRGNAVLVAAEAHLVQGNFVA